MDNHDFVLKAKKGDDWGSPINGKQLTSSKSPEVSLAIHLLVEMARCLEVFQKNVWSMWIFGMFPFTKHHLIS